MFELIFLLVFLAFWTGAGATIHNRLKAAERNAGALPGKDEALLFAAHEYAEEARLALPPGDVSEAVDLQKTLDKLGFDTNGSAIRDFISARYELALSHGTLALPAGGDDAERRTA